MFFCNTRSKLLVTSSNICIDGLVGIANVVVDHHSILLDSAGAKMVLIRQYPISKAISFYIKGLKDTHDLKECFFVQKSTKLSKFSEITIDHNGTTDLELICI